MDFCEMKNSLSIVRIVFAPNATKYVSKACNYINRVPVSLMFTFKT